MLEESILHRQSKYLRHHAVVALMRQRLLTARPIQTEACPLLGEALRGALA